MIERQKIYMRRVIVNIIYEKKCLFVYPSIIILKEKGLWNIYLFEYFTNKYKKGTGRLAYYHKQSLD